MGNESGNVWCVERTLRLLLRVWDAAVRAIAKATRIVLVGFSIPPADQHFKYLLSVGLKDNSSLRLVRIVDPRASALRPQYETVFREDQFKYGIASIREQRTADRNVRR